MSISTRLVLLLTLMVGAVMATASFLSLRQREAALKDAMRNEVQAHAVTLQLALEQDYAAGRLDEAQQLINRMRVNTRTYGVLLFDEHANLLMFSHSFDAEGILHPPELDRVIATGEAAEFVRVIDNQELFSIIMPIHVGDGWRGAIEIVQPLAFVQADISRARRIWIVTTLLLLSAIFGSVYLVMRRSLSQPVRELLGGAMAVGRGDLSYRVIVPRAGGEFAHLAREFNRMADHLAEQRERAAHAAEERLSLERELRHSEQLASVGRLAAGVAHEMGAPLNVIDARAEQLLNKLDAPPSVRERNLNIIRKQTNRITQIVRQLLNLARPYDLRRASLNLKDAVADALEVVEAKLIASRIEVKVTVSGDRQIIVDADLDFLRQALTNILTNAVQAMPDGGRLTIACRADAGRRERVLFASISVADTGAGIAPEHLMHIFEPFFTTKDVGSGTGLGLAVTRRIIEEHGGWIEVVNNPEGGAKFTIYLPQTAENEIPLAAVETSAHKQHAPSVT